MGLSAVLVRISRLVRLQQSKALNGIHSAEQFRAILERERAWADRNQSQFSVVVFGVGNPEADSTQVRHLAHVLANRIRLTDYTGWFDGSRIGAILPETSANGAWRLADDVCQTVAAKASPPECTVYTYPSGSKGPSDRSGHSGPFHIQDIPSKRKTTASSYSSASTKHTGRRNIDFTAQQPKRVFQRLIVGPRPSEKLQGTKAEAGDVGSIVDAGRQSHGALQPGEARATFETPSKAIT